MKHLKDLGIGVREPESKCDDPKCPFHGTLPVHGIILEGVVSSDKMDKTVVVKRERHKYIRKYGRYERRTTKIAAHNPPCIKAKVGDIVKIAECRPLSKTKHFVVVEKREAGKHAKEDKG